jgi:hypothetical protein
MEQTPVAGLSVFARKLGRTALSLTLKSYAEWRSHSAVSGTQFHDRRCSSQSR